MYEPRIYRKNINSLRFEGFLIVEEESDLWVGLSPGRHNHGYIDLLRDEVLRLRSILKDYIMKFPDFYTSLEPIPVLEEDAEIIQKMKKSGLSAGTGPMAAVAGMIAEETGRKLLSSGYGGELIIENGGDIFLSIKKDLILSVEAGDNKKFSSLGLNIPVAPGPLGICTSSGICGHSYSMGKADSVCVVSKSTCLADAWSTSIANKIITEEDVEKVLKNYDKDLLSVVAIKNDKIGISGIIELVPLK
jgi:ApbE superfamily uncharacterized protein (UPF0280 family)